MNYQFLTLVGAAALVFSVTAADASNPDSQDARTADVELVQWKGCKQQAQVFANSYDQTAKVSKPVNTKFRTFANELFFGIQIELEQSHPSDTLEIFLKQSRDSSKQRYYQFYGVPAKKDLAAFFYGQPNRYYKPFEDKDYTILYAKDPKTNNQVVLILLPWSIFIHSLPFEEADAAPWKFNIVRWRDGEGYTWQGKLHDPSTWGTLNMPKFPEEIKSYIYATCTEKLAMTPPAFDIERYDRGTYDLVIPELAKQVKAVQSGVQDKQSYAETQKAFHQIRDLYELRNELGISEFTTKDKRHGARFQLDVIPAGEIYLVNASCLKEPFKFQLKLDDEVIKEGTQADFPFNLKLPKEKLKSGSVLSLETDSALEKHNKISFAVAEFKHGMQPNKAYDVRYPAPTEAAPKRDLGGIIETEFLSRHKTQQRTIARANSRVVFIGDSITDGFRGPQWDRLTKFNAGNMGISGDWTQNVLWRLLPENGGVLQSVRPDVCVLMIGTNNNAYTPRETANGIAAILSEIKKLTPRTKVILMGILPRGTTFMPGNRYEQINDLIRKFHDGKQVFFYDIGKNFMDEKRTVKKELLPDLLHPNQAGYKEWVDFLMPILEQLTKEDK